MPSYREVIEAKKRKKVIPEPTQEQLYTLALKKACKDARREIFIQSKIAKKKLRYK